ncbi:trypsin-like peptidase domain-containing protein [Streptomyces sp. NPDC005538]|uniref:trypsin-like serine peptidase n=1 Tax=unclassified Streptomyces TaxID=2593676 RepID=UPI0033A29764
MKRTSRISRSARLAGSRRYALFVTVVTLALTSASVATADDGPGPFGVTVVAEVNKQSVRVGALFGAAHATSLAGGHHCTAAVVHSAQHDLIVSAAHCLDGDPGDVFVPGYRDGRAPYGVWKIEKRFLPDGWAKGQGEDSDIGFATVAPLDGKDIEDVVGADRFVTGMATGATAVTVTGYPSATDQPITCTNKPTVHSVTQQRIDCPSFTGGTSGSPWVNGDQEVVGVIGGHEQGGATADISYSVVFGAEAAELYRDATAE